MSNFKIKKKVLKTPSFSIFSTLGKLSFIPRKSIFYIFFEEFVFFGELFIIYYIFYILHQLKNAIYPPNIVISCFFYGIRILGGTFYNFTFFVLVYFILRDILWHFCLFLFYPEKIHFYKIFFHYKCSYKLSTIIQKTHKVIQKLSIFSKSVPKNPKKSRKIPKKSDFFTFFLMLSTTFLSRVDLSFIMQIYKKNVSKKSWKKSDFHFCKLFF